MTREQYEKWKEEHPGRRIFIYKRSVLDAFETPASMLYVVRGESEHLIPAVREFILGIDAEREQIRVHLIEGM